MNIGWVKEPILIFVIIGALLFGWQYVETDDQQVISVDRVSLIRFIENRTKNFTGSVAANFDELSDEALNDAANQFVREEALYRKAMALGLDREDYVIRQRLVQRMEYLNEGEVLPEPTDAELKKYFSENQTLFQQPPVVTFTHVFFSTDKNGDTTLPLATTTLTELRGNQIRFDQAPGYGDRFLYQLNYVEKSPSEIESHFGARFAESVFELTPGETWRGPIRSEHGLHLVMLTKKMPASIKPIGDVQAEVRDRFLAAKERQQKEAALRLTLDEFEIELSEEFTRRVRLDY